MQHLARGLAAGAADGPLRRARPGHHERRAAVVPRQRRRGLPEPRRPRERAADRGLRLRRRPHLSNGRLPDAGVPPRRRRRRDGRRDSGPGRGDGSVRHRRLRRPTVASSASARSRRSSAGVTGTRLASMGLYVFDCAALVREVSADAERTDSTHDFGKDVLPRMVETVHHGRLRLLDQHHPRHARRPTRLLARRRHASTCTGGRRRI